MAANAEATAAQRHALLALERGKGLRFLLCISIGLHLRVYGDIELTGCWVTMVVADGAAAGLAASMGACCWGGWMVAGIFRGGEIEGF